MTIGQTLALFRLNYKKTQQEFCQNILSFSYYAKVEKDKSNISAELLFKLLEVNHISIKEFYLAMNNQVEITENHVFNQIKKHYYTYNVKGLKHDLIDLTLIQNQKALKEYAMLIQELINKLENKPVNPNIVKKLQNYLANLDVWGRYEYRLFSLCSILFDIEVLQPLASKIIMKMPRQFQYTGYEEDISRSIIHLVIPFIQQRRLTEATYYLNMMDSLLRETTLVYEKMLLELLRSEINILEQVNQSESHKKIDDIKRMFALVDLESIPINILEEVSRNSKDN